MDKLIKIELENEALRNELKNYKQKIANVLNVLKNAKKLSKKDLRTQLIQNINNKFN